MSLRLVTSDDGTGSNTREPRSNFHKEIYDAWTINDQEDRMKTVFDIVTSWVGCANVVRRHGAGPVSRNRISGALLARLLLHIGYSYAFESGIKRYTPATFIYEVEKCMQEAGLDPNDC